jgi:hypothetical protein
MIMNDECCYIYSDDNLHYLAPSSRCTCIPVVPAAADWGYVSLEQHHCMCGQGFRFSTHIRMID